MTIRRLEAVPGRVGRCLSSVGAAGLRQNVTDVGCYRVVADRQNQGDVSVAAADRDKS